jgi:hypothetical protein
MSNDATETYLHSRLVEGLRIAENAARQIGHARRDIRWIRFATMLGSMVESAARATQRRVGEALLIAGREITEHRFDAGAR